MPLILVNTVSQCLGNWMEHDPAGQTLKAVLQELYQRDAVNTYLRDGETETEKKRENMTHSFVAPGIHGCLSMEETNYAQQSPLYWLKQVIWRPPGRRKTPSVDVDYRREFTLEASQQQPECWEGQEIPWLKQGRLAQSPANKPLSNVQGEDNSRAEFSHCGALH